MRRPMEELFAIAYWCGARHGWRNGDRRYSSNVNAIKAIVATTNACQRNGLGIIPMRVVIT